jgi:hypothetical protein
LDLIDEDFNPIARIERSEPREVIIVSRAGPPQLRTVQLGHLPAQRKCCQYPRIAPVIRDGLGRADHGALEGTGGVTDLAGSGLRLSRSNHGMS